MKKLSQRFIDDIRIDVGVQGVCGGCSAIYWLPPQDSLDTWMAQNGIQILHKCKDLK